MLHLHRRARAARRARRRPQHVLLGVLESRPCDSLRAAREPRPTTVFVQPRGPAGPIDEGRSGLGRSRARRVFRAPLLVFALFCEALLLGRRPRDDSRQSWPSALFASAAPANGLGRLRALVAPMLARRVSVSSGLRPIPPPCLGCRSEACWMFVWISWQAFRGFLWRQF